MLKNFLIFLAWVGACTLVYYNVKWNWAMPVFALVTLIVFLIVALVRSGKKGGSTLNCFVGPLLLLLAAEPCDRLTPWQGIGLFLVVVLVMGARVWASAPRIK